MVKQLDRKVNCYVFPADIYFFEVNIENTQNNVRNLFEVNYEQVSPTALVFPLMTLNK